MKLRSRPSACIVRKWCEFVSSINGLFSSLRYAVVCLVPSASGKIQGYKNEEVFGEVAGLFAVSVWCIFGCGADEHPHTYRSGDADRYSNAHRYANADQYPHALRYANANQHAHEHWNSDSD